MIGNVRDESSRRLSFCAEFGDSYSLTGPEGSEIVIELYKDIGPGPGRGDKFLRTV
jgi:hypothetical protein